MQWLESVVHGFTYGESTWHRYAQLEFEPVDVGPYKGNADPAARCNLNPPEYTVRYGWRWTTASLLCVDYMHHVDTGRQYANRPSWFMFNATVVQWHVLAQLLPRKVAEDCNLLVCSSLARHMCFCISKALGKPVAGLRKSIFTVVLLST